MTFVSEITSWTEFGLAGAIIGALYASLAVIIKWLIGHIDKQSERHSNDLSAMRESQQRIIDHVNQGFDRIVDKIDNGDASK